MLLDVKRDRNDLRVGSCLRVCTLVDISKPFRRCARIKLKDNGRMIWTDLKYEH